MIRIGCAALCLALGATIAKADDSRSVRGLFCQTEAQISEAAGYLRAGQTPSTVAAIMNRDAVRCVYADRIDYVVVETYLIDDDSRGGLYTYEATLTGVRVGDNLRPIEPALPIYFIRPDRLDGVAAAGKV